MTEPMPKLSTELYRAFKRLGAPVELLAIIGSIDDTLSDQECADLLKDYNDTGEYLYAQKGAH